MVKKLRSIAAFGLEVADLYTGAGLSRSAAALSYFLVLTLFPVLLCVNYLIGLFHLNLEQLLVSLDQLLPQGVLGIMGDYLRYVAGSQSSALLLAGLSTLLLSASSGLRTLFLAMDELYQNARPHVLRRLALSVVLSLLFLLTVYLSVVVIFTGDWFFGLLRQHLPRRIAQLVPLELLSRLWSWLRYLLLFCFVLLLVLIVYRAGAPRWVSNREVLLSGLLAAGAIVAASVLFSWFIGMSSRYALVYGSLASLMILLVWLYFCGNLLLLGVAVNRVWTRRRKK